MPIWGRIKLPRVAKISQFFEALMALLHLLLIEHVAMPYLSRVPGRGEESKTPSMLSFTSVSMGIHKKVISALSKYQACTHHGIGIGGGIFDCECVEALKSTVMFIQEANPLLERFCRELINLPRPLHWTHKAIVNNLVDLLKRHMEQAKTYFAEFEKYCPEDIKQYWEKYCLRDVNNMTSLTDDKSETGFWFPGREHCRTGITFSLKEPRQCNKKYGKSRKHSPGILTVQCACSSPKIIGVIIMTVAESVSLALSALLTHFKILPRTIYYDNACNMFVSALLRVPWIFKMTRMAVDRFHYKSHKCSAMFDPDSYPSLDSHRPETAESINARIEKSLPYMRYLGSDKLIPFLKVRLAMVNLCALYQQKFNNIDIEDVDLIQFFQSVCPCDCFHCRSTKSEGGKENVNGSDVGTGIRQELQGEEVQQQTAQDQGENGPTDSGRVTEGEENGVRSEVGKSRDGDHPQGSETLQQQVQDENVPGDCGNLAAFHEETERLIRFLKSLVDIDE